MKAQMGVPSQLKSTRFTRRSSPPVTGTISIYLRPTVVLAIVLRSDRLSRLPVRGCATETMVGVFLLNTAVTEVIIWKILISFMLMATGLPR